MQSTPKVNNKIKMRQTSWNRFSNIFASLSPCVHRMLQRACRFCEGTGKTRLAKRLPKRRSERKTAWKTQRTLFLLFPRLTYVIIMSSEITFPCIYSLKFVSVSLENRHQNKTIECTKNVADSFNCILLYYFVILSGRSLFSKLSLKPRKWVKTERSSRSAGGWVGGN